MTQRNDDLLRPESLIQPADAITMLQAEHRRIDKLLQWYAATTDPGLQARIALALFVALEVTIHLEAQVFYPALAEVTPPTVHALVATGLETHSEIEVAIEELRGLAVASAAFTTTFATLRHLVDQHRVHAERQLLPHAEVALAGQLEDLRDEMQDLKDDLLG